MPLWSCGLVAYSAGARVHAALFNIGAAVRVGEAAVNVL